MHKACSTAADLSTRELVRSQPELIVRRLEAATMLPVSREADTSESNGVPNDQWHQTSEQILTTGVEVKSWGTSRLTKVWPQPSKSGQLAFRQSPGGFQCRAVSPSFGWSMRQAWELLVSRSYLGWQIHLQPYIHSPGRALLIQLAEKDAVDDLCYLVESRQADLYRDVELRDTVLFVGHPPITDL